MICNDHSAIIFAGAETEVETLKKALVEAEERVLEICPRGNHV